MLLAVMVIVVAASAGGWMALNGGGSPEPAAAGAWEIVSEPVGATGVSDQREPRDFVIPVAPSRLANTKPSPATIEYDSSGDSFVADYGWVIALAIGASLAAVPIVGIYELRGLRLRGE
jgi:hypothetical protein